MVSESKSDQLPRKRKKKRKRRGPFKVHRYGGWSLYFWHGMRLRTWLALLARNRFRVTLNCLPNILTVSLVAPLNSVLYRLSELIHGRDAENLEFAQPPIFVLGHWRTGTTLLHDLLSCDPRFGFPTTYECYFPSHFLLTGRFAKYWFDLALPNKRPMDNMMVGADLPQEDEFALCNLGLRSPYLTMALPRLGPLDADYLDLRGLSDADRRDWARTFLWFLKRVNLAQRRRLVLKSPPHTARVRMLIELFPDARFIHIARHPHAVYPSTMKLWKALNSVQGLQNPADDEAWLEEFVLENFERLHACYREDRDLIPKGQRAEIRYEDLVDDPKAVLASLYRQLGLGDFSETEPAVEAYLRRTRDYKPNTHELPEEKLRLIDRRWRAYLETYGYGKAEAGD